MIRTVTAGESFGELALLQQTARRTASVLTAAAGQGTLGGSLQQNGADGSSLQQNGTSHGSLHGDGTVDGSLQGDGTVNLLRIAREDYNAAVSGVAVA